MITLKHGDVFDTQNDAMKLFGITLQPMHGGGWIIKDVLAAWFPKRAVSADGRLEAPDNIGWLNIVSDDEEEITEVSLQAEKPVPLADKPGGLRLVFLRGPDAHCRYTGLYTLAYLSPSTRTRVFTRLGQELPRRRGEADHAVRPRQPPGLHTTPPLRGGFFMAQAS
jgi:hypothetical protein